MFLFRNNDHRITLELDWEISPCKIVPASLSRGKGAERTCGRERAANYRYPGHEITALSPWRRLLRLDEVAAKVHQTHPLPFPYFLSLVVVHSASNSAFPSIPFSETPAEIMLPEISIKRGRIRFEPALDWICRVIVLEDGKKKLFGRKNGWLRDSKVRCPYHARSSLQNPSLSFSFLNLSPFALVILPVSLFTGKPPTPPRIEILPFPFPSRRDFLTYRFLEKVSFLETVFPNRGQPSSCKMTEVGGDTGTWEFVEEVELRSSCILYVRLRRSSIYYYYRSLAVLFTLCEILIQTLERLRDNFFVEKILF